MYILTTNTMQIGTRRLFYRGAAMPIQKTDPQFVPIQQENVQLFKKDDTWYWDNKNDIIELRQTTVWHADILEWARFLFWREISC